MEGFPREDINAVFNLKQLCISQVETVYRPGNPRYGKFDVLLCKVDGLYVAHAIVYPIDSDEGKGDHHYSWRCLVTGVSQHGVLAALEDLWNNAQRKLADPVKRICDGQTLYCSEGLFTIA
ncbi:hypothetical protein E8E13_008021 [Curvularia kusanoi]|uniref:Uncharacterized protein n=1 Tax=Curvularia kusanoi TaxID=90978 RepID=A0A9P4WA18_CURKU|nr:hypothetical protein E8E13_008021 [Curvularia kusanoi]